MSAASTVIGNTSKAIERHLSSSYQVVLYVAKNLDKITSNNNLMNHFAAFYLGGHTTPPTNTPSGDPLIAGGFYLNVNDNKLYFWAQVNGVFQWTDLNDVLVNVVTEFDAHAATVTTTFTELADGYKTTFLTYLNDTQTYRNETDLMYQEILLMHAAVLQAYEHVLPLLNHITEVVNALDELSSQEGAANIGKAGGGSVQDFIDKVERGDLTVIAAGSTTPRSLSKRFADIINVSDFGAVGDGITNDSPAFQLAIDSLTAGMTLKCNVPTMYLEDTVSRSGMPDNCTIDIDGCTIKSDQSSNILRLEGGTQVVVSTTLGTPSYTTPVDNTTLQDPNVYVRGVRKYTLADTTNVAAGDLIIFHSTRIFDSAKETYETNRIWKVEGNTVYVDGEASVAFESGDEVLVYKLTQGLTIKNGTVDSQNTSGSTGVYIQNFNRPRVKDVNFLNVGQNGLYIRRCAEDKTNNCNILSAGSPANTEAGYQGEFGYGIIHTYSCFSKVSGCTGSEGWHSFEAADGQRDITYNDCTSISDGHGFSTHENCVSATYIDCHSQARLPNTNRARYVKYKGGTYTKTSVDASFSGGKWEFEMDGVTFSTPLEATTPRHIALIYFPETEGAYPDEPQAFTTKLIVKNCNLTLAGGYANIGNIALGDVVFENNTLISTGNGKVSISAKNVIARNNVFRLLDSTQTGTSYTAVAVKYRDSAEFKGNTIDSDVTGYSQLDVFAWSCTQDNVNSPILFTYNTFNLKQARYPIRAQGVGKHMLSSGNVLRLKDKASGTIGRTYSDGHILTSIDNVYGTGKTPSDTYNITFGGTTLVEALGDYFIEQGSIYYGTLPVSDTSIVSGMLWNNAGVLTVKA